MAWFNDDYNPGIAKMKKIIRSERFRKLLADAQERHKGERLGGLARLAFAQYMGWPISFGERYSAPGLGLEKRNSINWVYNQYRGDGAALQRVEGYDALDAAEDFGQAVKDEVGKTVNWLVPTTKFLIVGGLLLIVAPHVLALFKEVRES